MLTKKIALHGKHAQFNQKSAIFGLQIGSFQGRSFPTAGQLKGTKTLGTRVIFRCFGIFSPLSPKTYMLFAGLGSVRIVKNCDRGLENAALGLRPWAAFSSPRSQFFTIRTDPKPANNLFIYFLL